MFAIFATPLFSDAANFWSLPIFFAEICDCLRKPKSSSFQIGSKFIAENANFVFAAVLLTQK